MHAHADARYILCMLNMMTAYSVYWLRSSYESSSVTGHVISGIASDIGDLDAVRTFARRVAFSIACVV